MNIQYIRRTTLENKKKKKKRKKEELISILTCSFTLKCLEQIENNLKSIPLRYLHSS